jgi:hypothetical protein
VKDRALQRKIVEIGRKLVPRAISELPDSDPYKSHFHFYVVDDRKMLNPMAYPNGFILISSQAILRLKNDDQVAATLSMAIASILQRDTQRMLELKRKSLLAIGASSIAGTYFSAFFFMDLSPMQESIEPMYQIPMERVREGMQLLDNAGYKLQEAPESCLLLSTMKLPQKPDDMVYPDFCSYQNYVIANFYKDQTAFVSLNLNESGFIQ